jgi:signal transduction histidine kinase
VKLRSIRVRLLLAAIGAIFLALAVAWAVMTLLFARHIERRVQTELTRTGEILVASVATSAEGLPTLTSEPVDSRLETPAGGLYWQVSTEAGSLRSRSLWDQVLPPSPDASLSGWTLRVTAGPHEPEIVLVERIVHPEREGARVLVQVASENTSLLLARDEFGEDLGLFLLALWVVLSAAAWLQVKLGLAPLTRVSAEVQTLKTNTLQRLSFDHPLEIEPLVRAINAVADARESDLVKARRRSADLAHAMRTPLAAMSAQARRARDAGAVEAADGLEKAIDAATLAVEGELAKARVAVVRDSLHQSRTPAAPCVEAIVGVIERTDSGARILFEVNVAPDVHVPIPREDLMELLGALIENASRYAHRLVRVRGHADGHTEMTVEDDGPGIAENLMNDALVRGRRLDEKGAGFGLGLAIAQDLAEATGASLSLRRSGLGGLRVSITWPRIYTEPAS